MPRRNLSTLLILLLVVSGCTSETDRQPLSAPKSSGDSWQAAGAEGRGDQPIAGPVENSDVSSEMTSAPAARNGM